MEKIAEQLQEMFQGYSRKIVFWYDEQGEYESQIGELALNQVKIHRLTQTTNKKGELHTSNQFHTKWLLEREDLQSHYLIYAPFPKPPLIDHHLEDIMLYSKCFYADRPSMVAKALGFGEDGGRMVRKYRKFFASNDRIVALQKLEADLNQDLELAMMCVVCKLKSVQFPDLMRKLLGEDLEDSPSLLLLEKYELSPLFWKMCEEKLGFAMASPSLTKLVYCLFLTATHKVLQTPINTALEQYLSPKGNSCVTMLDYLMCYQGFDDRFTALSHLVYEDLMADRGYFSNVPLETCLNLEFFPQVDDYFLQYLIGQGEQFHLEQTLGEFSLEQVCNLRLKMNFGRKTYYHSYQVVKFALFVLKTQNFVPDTSAVDMVENYVNEDYKVDQQYRLFYYHYDQLQDTNSFENLRLLVENTYTNKFLNPLSVAWTKSLAQEEVVMKKQIHFYQNWVMPVKERVVVLISDALRYEVAKSLTEKLELDEKCEPKLYPMLGVLPSYTRLGMSALLPHETLELTTDFEVELDGKQRYDLISREETLKNISENHVAIRFEKLEQMTSGERRDFSSGKEVIYVYHDQIDNIGDDSRTEHQVFSACQQAVEQIHSFILKMSSANNTKFIITADHGFIYKRDALSESDKISDYEKNEVHIARRYLISDEKVETEGVISLPLGKILENQDKRMITVPIGSDVFKKQGAGQNFVHGGGSLQELILPVLEVKTRKGKQETRVVSLTVVNMPKKITNTAVKIHFLQNEPVSDLVKAGDFRFFFQDGEGNILCKEQRYRADSAVTEGSKRGFSFVFHLNNQKYSQNKEYFFVIVEEQNDIKVVQEEVRIDLVFTDDYGF